MVDNKRREIEVLIRARYPLIYVVSQEEKRVENYLLRLARKQDKKIYHWSYTTGIVPLEGSSQSQSKSNSATKDPLMALKDIQEQVEPAIYVLKDFHPFLKENNFAVIRQLKELAFHLKESYKSLVLLSPTLCIPPELEKEITVVDFPLPTTGDLHLLLKRILQDLSDNPNVQVELREEDREKLLQAALGLTLSEAENVFAKILVMNKGRLKGEDAELIANEKRQIIRKSGLLEYYEPEVGVGEVGGLEVLKDWLVKRRSAFGKKAQDFGLPAPKGVLLLGVQGCGKSLCAKAVSQLWSLPLLRFDVGRVFGSLVGSSEENMRKAIHIAESISPCVMWVDEIDKALAGSTGTSTDSGTTSRVIGTFLTWLSEKKKPVFVIATANDISKLPPELLRKGRLDEIFYVDLPREKERREIFKIHLEKRDRNPAKFDLDQLARQSEGFSGAEIEEAIVSALYDAFYQERQLNTKDVTKSLQATVPLSRTMEEQLSHFRNWAQGRARNASFRAEEKSEGQSAKRKIEL